MLHSLVAQLTVLTAQTIQARHSKLPICWLRGAQYASVGTLVLYILCCKEHAHSSSSTQDPRCLLAPYGHRADIIRFLVALKYYYSRKACACLTRQPGTSNCWLDWVGVSKRG